MKEQFNTIFGLRISDLVNFDQSLNLCHGFVLLKENNSSTSQKVRRIWTLQCVSSWNLLAFFARFGCGWWRGPWGEGFGDRLAPRHRSVSNWGSASCIGPHPPSPWSGLVRGGGGPPSTNSSSSCRGLGRWWVPAPTPLGVLVNAAVVIAFWNNVTVSNTLLGGH